MSRLTYTEEQLKEAVANSKSIAGVLRCLNLRPIGGNYRTIKEQFEKYNIDTSHFTGQGWNVGLKFKPYKKMSNEEIFIENSSYKNSNNLRKRILQIRDYRCEKCGNTKWLEVSIPLEIHHINGINTDNRLENLQLLCPNCHALTDNYRGKNQLSALSEKKEVEYRKFKETLTDNADGNLEPSLLEILLEGAETRHDKPKSSRIKIQKPKSYCLCCGKELVYKQKKYCSLECAHDMISKRPDAITLLEAFKLYKSYLQVGKYFSVTDNAVRKWCKLYKINEDTVKELSRPQT